MRLVAPALAVLALLLAACSVADAIKVGPDPQAGHGFRAVVHVNGDFDGQTFMEAVPTSALVRAHGDMTVTLRAYPPPFLVVDGDGNVIVEPLPGKEAEAQAAVRAGHILIRRAGVAGDLNAPGTRAAYIGGFMRLQKAREAKAAAPAPPAPAGTSSTVEPADPKEPPVATTECGPDGCGVPPPAR